MEKTVKFYFSAFRTYFEYQLPFDTEQYDKFKALCVACAEDEDTNFASLGLLAERCEEFEEDDAWFTSDDAMDLETNIFQFVVNKAVNDEFGDLKRIIQRINEDFFDENPELLDEMGRPSEAAAIEFFNELEGEYSPLFELDVTSL